MPSLRQVLTTIGVKFTENILCAGRKWLDWPEVSERVVEYAFIMKKMNLTAGRILEVGCVDAHNCLPTVFAALGYETHAIDRREFKVKYPNLTFSRQDAMSISYPDNYFDRILAISAIEHIGLSGRYGVKAGRQRGDREAVEEMIRVLKPDGRLLITVPYGNQCSVVDSLHRIYDRETLSGYLFNGLEIKSEEYTMRDKEGYWIITTQEEAGSTDVRQGFKYAVAMFELGKEQ